MYTFVDVIKIEYSLTPITMKTEIMLYDRSRKKFQKLFPNAIFEGYENSFGGKCWFSLDDEINKIRIIRICIESKIKLLIVR